MAVVVLFDGCEQIDKSILEYFDYLDKELDIAPDKTLKHRTNIFSNQGIAYLYNQPQTLNMQNILEHLAIHINIIYMQIKIIILKK